MIYIKTVLTFPIAAVYLHPHTYGAAVVTVRDESHPAGPDWRVQVPLGLQISVGVALQHL